MHRPLLLVGYVAVFCTSVRSTPFTNVVQTTAGPIRGEELTFENTRYKAFKGIPYAAPPFGNLRFKAPEPPQKWTNLRDATNYGKACPQHSPLSISASEDCLTLNVFTQTFDTNDLKPVLLFIHPGNFAFGDASGDFFGPQYLIQENIVLVTINFRLGPLGFLSTNTSDASGNWGLKDQVAALKWVQENIKEFGGNPSQVTLYGLLSGAASVHLHMFSPLSKGLFHKAIISTGSATNRWILRRPAQSVKYSQNLARILGAPDSDIQDPAKRMKFLRAADAAAMSRLAFNITDEVDSPLFTRLPFFPVLEAAGTERAFLTEDPTILLKEGRFNKVPMMIGVTDLQGVQFFGGAVNIPVEAMRKLEDDVCQILPKPLRTAVSSKNECSNIHEGIRRVYFNGLPFESSLLGLVYLFGDAYLNADLHYAQKMHARFSSKETPIFNYYFSFDGKWNVFKIASLPGAAHADEIPYVFKITESHVNLVKLPPTSPEVITKNRMVRYIGNFVKYGHPAPSVSDLIPVQWEPATGQDCTTMVIGNELKLERDLLKSRMDFWDILNKKYLGLTI